jgi:hypothetical protein
VRREKKIQLVYIEWCDAISKTEGWESLEDAKNWAKSEDWIIRQAGYLIEDNPKYILLAGQYNPQKETEDQFSNLTKIPKTWILKRKNISTH